jgi:hypothetical protein
MVVYFWEVCVGRAVAVFVITPIFTDCAVLSLLPSGTSATTRATPHIGISVRAVGSRTLRLRFRLSQDVLAIAFRFHGCRYTAARKRGTGCKKGGVVQTRQRREGFLTLLGRRLWDPSVRTGTSLTQFHLWNTAMRPPEVLKYSCPAASPAPCFCML